MNLKENVSWIMVQMQEKLIIEQFSNKNQDLVTDAQSLLTKYFPPITEKEDHVAYDSKKRKGILTVCDQNEKELSGYSLNVIIRDTKMLSGVFDSNNANSQMTQLFQMIQSVFPSFP
jgi:hypothetical protein